MAMTDMGTIDQRASATPQRGQTPPQSPTGASGEPFGDQTTQQASPEEQALYDKVVAQAFDLIYDKRMLPGVVEMLKGGGDPVEGLATAAAQITARVASAAQQAGQQIPPDVLLHAGTEIYEDLADLSGKVGIKDFSQDQDAFEGAYFRALDQFRMLVQEAGGADQKSAQADLAKLEQMDQSGELEKMLMGLAENDPRQGKRETEPRPAGGLMQGMN